jgi:hypothetical protein
VFGNGLKRDYKHLHFTMLAGVTPAIDQMTHAAFGERFLKFRADRDVDRSDDMDRALRAIGNCGSEDAMRSELRDACVRALQREFSPESVPVPTPAFALLVAKLSLLIASMRAVAPVEKGTDKQTMSPVVEAPPRLATQFVKFAQGCALHLEATSLEDPRVERLTRRVALHTVDTIPAQVVQVLEAIHATGGTTQEICALLPRLSRDTVYDVLRRMQRTSMVNSRKDHAGSTVWRLTEKHLKLLTDSGLFRDLPASDVHHRTDLPRAGAIPVRKSVLTVKRKS